MRTISIKELKNDTNNLINNAVISHEFFKVHTDNGKAVVINEQEWNILIEAFQVLSKLKM